MSIDRRDDGRSGDPIVDRSWRAAATDAPSTQLDAAILAAARAATARPQPASSTRAPDRWWTRWQPLVAAAGVAGLAFSVVQMVPRDQEVRLEPVLEAVRSERAEVAAQDSAAAPAAPSAAAAPPAPAESAAAMEREAAPRSAAAAKGAPSALAMPVAPAAPAPAPSVAPAPAPPPATDTRATKSIARRDAAEQSAENDAYAARVLGRAAQQAAGLPMPDAWGRRVEALHATGDHVAAAEELRAFRAAYPDADQYLPESLQPWAATLESPAAPVATPE